MIDTNTEFWENVRALDDAAAEAGGFLDPGAETDPEIEKIHIRKFAEFYNRTGRNLDEMTPEEIKSVQK
jgi:hypothetical protein